MRTTQTKKKKKKNWHWPDLENMYNNYNHNHCKADRYSNNRFLKEFLGIKLEKSENNVFNYIYIKLGV